MYCFSPKVICFCEELNTFFQLSHVRDNYIQLLTLDKNNEVFNKAGEAIAIRRGAQPIMRFATNKKKKKK
jgi:hypothetical protein